MSRLTITLKQNERDALLSLAEREFREPRAQAALLIRAELERLGLLPREPLPANGAPIVAKQFSSANIAPAQEGDMQHAKHD